MSFGEKNMSRGKRKKRIMCRIRKKRQRGYLS
jgi:hypothetical protein